MVLYEYEYEYMYMFVVGAGYCILSQASKNAKELLMLLIQPDKFEKLLGTVEYNPDV